MSRLHNDWATMVGQSRRLRDERFRKEALTFAREMMKLARGALESIVQTLRSSGYRFVDEDKALIEPEAGIEDWLREQEKFGIHVPLSVQAWLIEVGAINLMGTHPESPHPAYLFEATSSEGVWYTDPLVVELPREYILYLHEGWNHRRREDGVRSGWSFAPDDIHNANVSGGPPYEVDAFAPSVDALVLNERNGHTFVAHVRHALEWGGFPGFRYLPEVPESARRYVSGTIVM